MVEITVNGQKKIISPKKSLLSLIESLRLCPTLVIAEKNKIIIPKKDLHKEFFLSGDRIELLEFLGGG